MQTFNIENQAFYRIFSMENDPVHVKYRISSKIITNRQIIERVIYDRGLTYTWTAFSRKFYSIKLQTLKFENIKFKVSARSKWSHCLCRNNDCHEKTIRGRFEQQTTLRSQSSAKFKDIIVLQLEFATPTKCFQDIWLTLNYIVIQFRSCYNPI